MATILDVRTSHVARSLDFKGCFSPEKALSKITGSGVVFVSQRLSKDFQMAQKSRIINIGITFRNMEATDALRNYANDKLKKCLTKFAQHDLEAHVVLRVEKNRQIAEVSFLANGNNIVGKEESDDLYTAIDLLVGSLTQQLRKHKEKLTNRH
jgi:putative sigma-54 modulation protein